MKSFLTQINNFIKLLANELLVFWKTGIFYSHTPRYPHGQQVYAAIIALVSNLVTLDQVLGMALHSTKFFCSACYLKLDKIANFDLSTWPQQDLEGHWQFAAQWRNSVDP